MEGEDDHPLIAACAGCRGTSRWVHYRCVQQYFASQERWWDLTCPTCRHLYEGSVAVQLGHYGLGKAQGIYGDGSAYVARVLVNVGSACGRAGDAVRQKEYLEIALRISEREYGPHHPEVAVALTSLSTAEGRLGNAGQQKVLLERALEINERQYGADHPMVAVVLANLGNARGALGDPIRQRDLLEGALKIKEAAYGPHHREVAMTLAFLAEAQAALHELGHDGGPDARQTADAAYKLARAAHGRPNAIVGDLALSRASVHEAAGDSESARQRWSDAVEELREALGEDATRSKVRTFATRSRGYWAQAQRPDVLEKMLETLRTQVPGCW